MGRADVRIVGAAAAGDGERGAESRGQGIVAEHLRDLSKGLDVQAREAERAPSKVSADGPAARRRR